MITQSGPVCDVCGKYILPGFDESVNFFTVSQLPGSQLCCHDKCKEAVLGCGGNWEKLPEGPLRKGYEEAAKILAQPSTENKPGLNRTAG
jgi:hypothetical protein